MRLSERNKPFPGLLVGLNTRGQMVDQKHENFEGELINMTRPWDKEKF